MSKKQMLSLVTLALAVFGLSGAARAVAAEALPAGAAAPAATPAPAQSSGMVKASEGLALGPDSFPQGTNPLTGLPVDDPNLLALPPALVSVSNFPVSARPQAGLSSSPMVFELYIGHGMTRFLAMFYGNFPQANASGDVEGSAIGPVRSGRLPYESLRRLYHGALITSGASPDVGAQLNQSGHVYGTDDNDINSALINVTRLQKIAEASAERLTAPLNLTGNRFDAAAQDGGASAATATIFYNTYNQIQWTYDAAQGAYLRAQDKADASGDFYPSSDRLNGEPLAFENVVILFAQHNAQSSTIIDIDLKNKTGPALLFRDGKVYQINWTTRYGEYEKKTGLLRPIRFVDAQGNPFALKPGQTWVEFVTPYSTAKEKSAGNWYVRFYQPAVE